MSHILACRTDAGIISAADSIALDVNPIGISSHQRSWGYEDGPGKGLRPAPLLTADF